MKTVRKGQRFGDWEVIDPKILREKRKHYVLCYCHKYENLKYVIIHNLISGHSTSSKQGNRPIGSWSTRTKHKDLPKYVHPFTGNNGNKYYRVIYKEPTTNTTRTIGYYHTLEQAKEIAELLD